MQADVQSIQSTHHIYCPLCHAPLVCRTGDNAIGISDGTSSSDAFCSSCGYAGPVMSRQHARKAQPRTPRSSVWIDPAVSTYLKGEQIEQIEQSSPALSQRVEPTTPIPPRASAQRIRAVQVRPRYPYNRTQVGEESDAADVPTQPPPAAWQYDSEAYTAESSLSSLSLIVDTPTNPRGIPTPPTMPDMPATPDTPPHGMPRIEEMETRPPAIIKSTIEGIVDSTVSAIQNTHNPRRAIEEQATIPMQLSPARTERAHGINSTNGLDGEPLPGAASLFLGTGLSNETPTRALAPIMHAAPTVQTASIVPTVMPSPASQLADVEPVSWTAGAAAGSRYAQLVAARTNRKKSSTSFNIFDRLRWWLLHPGRFEFLLWLGGTILLMTVTCIFLLMMVFSVHWSASDTNNGASSSLKNTNNPAGSQISTPGLSLAVTHDGALIAGQPLHLRGKGFGANNHIALSYDANRLFLKQDGQPVLVRADAHGTFIVTLASPSWGLGQHRIVARDLATGSLATATVVVVAATKSATVPPVMTTPGVEATATASQQGNHTPPVGQTPTVVPTAGITPTTTPKTPTPTVGITPTATVGTTPTVGITVTPKLGQTPPVGVSVTPNLSETATVGNTNPAVLNTQLVAASGSATITTSPWLWLLIGGYTFAMLLFGLGGLIHKR